MLCGLAVDRCYTAVPRILGVDLGILAGLGPDGEILGMGRAAERKDPNYWFSAEGDSDLAVDIR